MPLPPERRLTDSQVAIVLKTAAELQERDGGSGSGRGLTISQLEQVAAEAGIDSAILARAVARLDEGGTESHNVFLGGPGVVVVERSVQGEVGAEDSERLLSIVRRVTGQLGEPTVVGRLFGWKGHLDEAACEVSVSSESGTTTVRVRLSPEQHIVGQFMLKGMLGGVGGGLVGAAASSILLGPAAVFVGVTILGAGYLSARRGYQGDLTRLRGRAADLADALAEPRSG